MAGHPEVDPEVDPEADPEVDVPSEQPDGRGAPSQTDVVVEGIKKMIFEGTLGPGQRLPVEADLARALGVSRGPLREGVRALSHLGVLETRQGAGTYVTALDPSLLLAPMSFLVDLHHAGGARALHSVRRLLETEAAALAARCIDDEALAAAQEALDAMAAPGGVEPREFVDADIRFHQVVAQASGNPVLAALVQAFAGRTVRARVWRALTDEGATARTLEEHRAVLEALRAHDPDRARLRMGHHLLAVEDFLAGAEEPPAEGPPAEERPAR
ncbi:FadR/GntR family transcriptional regulator [Kineococcus indalonis]|uniref:FadR/GntR family transcriptional regulator n=1 Tax=Kineococcus indalonis TaxID=2696566 RepID=UPI002B1BE4AB|nr:FCD domain-containing protein [Kineococcus indalonis]